MKPIGVLTQRAEKKKKLGFFEDKEASMRQVGIQDLDDFPQAVTNSRLTATKKAMNEQVCEEGASQLTEGPKKKFSQEVLRRLCVMSRG